MFRPSSVVRNAVATPELLAFIDYLTNEILILGRITFFNQTDSSVATSPLALRWVCDSLRTGCARITSPMYMWHEQAKIEWLRRMISVVACCHTTVWSFAHLPLGLYGRNTRWHWRLSGDGSVEIVSATSEIKKTLGYFVVKTIWPRDVLLCPNIFRNHHVGPPVSIWEGQICAATALSRIKRVTMKLTKKSALNVTTLQAVASGAASGAPLHLKYVSPHFSLTPGCCIHPILYLKICPFVVSGPPCCEILATGLPHSQ